MLQICCTILQAFYVEIKLQSVLLNQLSSSGYCGFLPERNNWYAYSFIQAEICVIYKSFTLIMSMFYFNWLDQQGYQRFPQKTLDYEQISTSFKSAY